MSTRCVGGVGLQIVTPIIDGWSELLSKLLFTRGEDGDDDGNHAYDDDRHHANAPANQYWPVCTDLPEVKNQLCLFM